MLEHEEDLCLTLTIKFNNVSVDLTINETLIVINTLAVKRAQIRGGAWSTMGKAAEKVLMETLCKLYSVPEDRYVNQTAEQTSGADREVDFYLLSSKGARLRCEVKLMGKGNPESADALFARDSNMFVADTLSDLNKQQADELGVSWVALRDIEGYKRITRAFERFGIPFEEFGGSLEENLERILDEVL